jgi:CheY-like chemotaxis protein
MSANGYIKKPTRFDKYMGIAKSIEEFWLGVVNLPERLPCCRWEASFQESDDERSKVHFAVEDNPGDALLVTVTVGDCGGACELKTTDRLASALKLLDEEEFALIITDLNLPDSTGTGLIRSIMKRNLSVPVIVLSGTYPSQPLGGNFTASNQNCSILCTTSNNWLRSRGFVR